MWKKGLVRIKDYRIISEELIFLGEADRGGLRSTFAGQIGDVLKKGRSEVHGTGEN